MDKQTTSNRKTTPLEGITPTINHKIIRALGTAPEGLGLRDLAESTALSIEAARSHLFSLMVAGIVEFQDDSLYELTTSGRKLLEDILS